MSKALNHEVIEKSFRKTEKNKNAKRAIAKTQKYHCPTINFKEFKLVPKTFFEVLKIALTESELSKF